MRERLIWLQVDEKTVSISEEVYVDIMQADQIKLTEYLIDPSKKIRTLAERRIKSIKTQEQN